MELSCWPRDTHEGMELLALFALSFIAATGCCVGKVCLPNSIRPENQFYFAPAIGLAVCGLVGYAAVRIHAPWLILVFFLIVTGCFVYSARARRPGALRATESSQLLRFTLLVFLCLYGMQIVLYRLFSTVYPGPHEVWSLFNLSGVSPPDQMFAWHQAMFLDRHSVYPRDPFYLDMDLYDRPHLGGYVTLFFFKLFRLPLTEHNFVYPPSALRFYHCFWWLLNNLYLLGVAPLFQHLLRYRGAILAVSSSALGGFFFLCNVGAWTKFASVYPLLLAFLLFLEGRGPVVQAALCATSYYLHGSVLPFLAGFGALQVLGVRYPITGRQSARKDVALFAAIAVALVGSWFFYVRWVGSKQPLLYYYLYGAGLTDAQTMPLATIVKSFYAQHSWRSLALLPVHNWLASILPVSLFGAVRSWVRLNQPGSLSDLATVIFVSQRFCIECALGIIVAPVVLAGCIRALAREHSGKTALCLYLIPSLIVALVYRREWSFSLHIVCVYHTLALFLWVYALRNTPVRYLMIGLGAIALEGIICVLFADTRFLPVNGLRLSQIPAAEFIWLGAYLTLTSIILGMACLELKRAFTGPVVAARSALLIAAGKLLIGILVIVFVLALYAWYCWRLYR